MLSFLANNVEQLDLALEHVLQGDANNARFGMMLTDNVVEITLHQLALDRQRDLKNNAWRYEENPYPHERELGAALGRHFESKVKFAVAESQMSAEEAASITALHNERNQVYHLGVRDDVVLPAMARFYLNLATNFLARYKPPFFGYNPRQKLPTRAAKYFTSSGPTGFRPGRQEDYAAACAVLHAQVLFETPVFVLSLAAHMGKVIEQVDASIDFLAGFPHNISRDQAVAETQAWSIAFKEEGKLFVRDYVTRTGQKPTGITGYVALLGQEYPFQIRHDPIASWRTSSSKLRKEANPHHAMSMYRSFMSRTEEFRALIEEAHSLGDIALEAQIDRAREERATRAGS